MDGDNSDQNKLSLLSAISRFWSRRQRISSEEELQKIIIESEEQGIINEDEGDMLHSIFEFGETIVREIMVPRTEMVSCDKNASLREALDKIIKSGHSRIPIFEGTIDTIVGFIYAKDLLKHWGEDPAKTSIKRMVRPPYFIPESKKIESLLQDFKTQRVHIAIVVDEYGGTSGLVTIEDLLEEIVGEIQDEYDLEENLLVEEPDGSLLVDGGLPLDELEEYFDMDIRREKFDTVGGYLIHLLDQVPVAGDDIVAGDLHMTVVESDDRRVLKVRVVGKKGRPENGH